MDIPCTSDCARHNEPAMPAGPCNCTTTLTVPTALLRRTIGHLHWLAMMNMGRFPIPYYEEKERTLSEMGVNYDTLYDDVEAVIAAMKPGETEASHD